MIPIEAPAKCGCSVGPLSLTLASPLARARVAAERSSASPSRRCVCGRRARLARRSPGSLGDGGELPHEPVGGDPRVGVGGRDQTGGVARSLEEGAAEIHPASASGADAYGLQLEQLDLGPALGGRGERERPGLVPAPVEDQDDLQRVRVNPALSRQGVEAAADQLLLVARGDDDHGIERKDSGAPRPLTPGGSRLDQLASPFVVRVRVVRDDPDELAVEAVAGGERLARAAAELDAGRSRRPSATCLIVRSPIVDQKPGATSQHARRRPPGCAPATRPWLSASPQCSTRSGRPAAALCARATSPIASTAVAIGAHRSSTRHAVPRPRSPASAASSALRFDPERQQDRVGLDARPPRRERRARPRRLDPAELGTGQHATPASLEPGRDPLGRPRRRAGSSCGASSSVASVTARAAARPWRPPPRSR